MDTAEHEIRFIGGRYETGALDIHAMRTLVAYDKLVRITAEHLWKKDHPERKRLPNGFSKLRLRIISISPCESVGKKGVAVMLDFK